MYYLTLNIGCVEWWLRPRGRSRVASSTRSESESHSGKFSLWADVSILKCPEICHSGVPEDSESAPTLPEVGNLHMGYVPEPTSTCTPAWLSVIARFSRAIVNKEEREQLLDKSRPGVRDFCDLCRPPRASARTKKCRPPKLDKALEAVVQQVRLTRTQSRGVTEDPSISALEPPPEEPDIEFTVVDPGAYVQIRLDGSDALMTGIIERAVLPTSLKKWNVRIVEGSESASLKTLALRQGRPLVDRVVLHEAFLTIIPATAEVIQQREDEAEAINDVLEICDKKPTKVKRDQCCMTECFTETITDFGYNAKASCISSCIGLMRTSWSAFKTAVKANLQ